MEKETNKNTFVSVGKWLLIAIGVAVGVRGLVNSYKKELKNLSDAKKKEDKDIESLGVSPERMRDQVYDCEREEDRNMVKAMYVAIDSSPSWPESVIKEQEVLVQKSIVRVLEEEGGWGHTNLTFLLEIPHIVREKKGDFSIPPVGSFYTAFKNLKDHLWKKEVGCWAEPLSKKTVYLAYSYKMGETEDMTTVEIPRKIWDHWRTEYDGLVEFYDDVHENGLVHAVTKRGLVEELREILTNDFVRKNPNVMNLNDVQFHYEDLILMYKISFKQARFKEDTGITVMSGLDCLRYITENLVVSRQNQKGFHYDKVMFQAPSESGEFDNLTRYYTTDTKNRVVSDSYGYPEDEEEDEYGANSIFERATIKKKK